jgi:SSS family solute:Na+ symporter
MRLVLVDWLIIAVYAIVIFTVGMFIVKKPKTSEGYFLANRKLRWPFIGASLFASNISAEHFVGLAGSGFALGMAIGTVEWSAVYCLLPLILLFLPLYMKNNIYTVPEFLEKRFNARVRTVFSGMMLVLSILTKISISLWASSIVFSSVLGWDRVTVIWLVGLITAIYTMKGGLNAVVYTDAIQSTILLIAGVILTTIGMHHVGWWQGLKSRLDPSMFHMMKPATDLDLPWPGVILGFFLAGSFYWSMDQVLVQRVFAARDLNEGRKGAVFCGFLKLLTPLVLVLPGLIAKALYSSEIKVNDDAYPVLLQHLMPNGLLGLTVAGISAALMGHLSATYNSIATLFTRDFYLKLRPEASNTSQIRVGRLAVLAVFVLGAVWAPVIGSFKSLFIYLQVVSIYLMMPFVGVFFLGVLWKRVNVAGVYAAVTCGFTAGLTLMFDSQMHFLPFMKHPLLRPWLHGAVIEFVLCAAVLVVASLLTVPPSAESVRTTTIDWSAREPCRSDRVSFVHDYRPYLLILVVTVTALWYWMR